MCTILYAHCIMYSAECTPVQSACSEPGIPESCDQGHLDSPCLHLHHNSCPPKQWIFHHHQSQYWLFHHYHGGYSTTTTTTIWLTYQHHYLPPTQLFGFIT